MSIYSITAAGVTKPIHAGKLKLGGSNPQGDKISFNNYFMEMNGTPYFAICGELHYSRYPFAEWENEIIKMKMSGINTMASYIFWNHHEEVEGCFDWTGNRDLRSFVQLCAKHGLFVILRVGPFCHGEARNGGLPDWLFGRSFEVRSNDEDYLTYVKQLYDEIGKQAVGLMYKDGGPVIGVQLENELMHAAALWELTAKTGDEYLSGGSGGEEHMRILKKLALEAGLDAPFYTSTGWGGAPVLEDEVLPLYGGYAYTPWTVNENNPNQKPTEEYIFRDFHNNEAQMDYYDPPYPREQYPFACCEMGGGMQTWYLARFIVEPESVAAMTMMKVAGGCNFIGYYMYHGGTNPIGQSAYMNESTTPKLSYDFQAPLGEFGQVRRSDNLLRPIHYFFRSFGGHLAPMATVLPAGAADIRPDDTDTLRYAIRVKDGSGYVFVNNYQDHVGMKAHQDVRFEIDLGTEKLQFPREGITIEKNVSTMLPFNLPLADGALLKYATAMPVTSMTDGGRKTYFFASARGVSGELALAGKSIVDVQVNAGKIERIGEITYVTTAGDRESIARVQLSDGSELQLCMLTAKQSECIWEADYAGQRRLFLSDIPVLVSGVELKLMFDQRSTVQLQVFPALEAGLSGEGIVRDAAANSLFDCYQITNPAVSIALEVQPITDRKVRVTLDDTVWDSVDDVLLQIDYEGNVGFAFADGELFHDNFYNGTTWEIGLARFRERLAGREMILQVTPLHKGKVVISADAAFALQKTFTGESIAKINAVKAIPIRYMTIM
jgi:beta-galactosidase